MNSRNIYENYEVVIGLEVHVELATKTKIFCGCSAAFGGRPNTHICPVCMGMPGTLPVLNKKVVEYAIAVGRALACKINREIKFDRKNYFYPDNPQNYQISQLYLPICQKGKIKIETSDGEKEIGIHEIHMEEDAGKLFHNEKGETLVDFNRAGVPLIEIVSQPDMRNSSEVIAYLEKLKSFITYLGASDCKMNEGSMRADVNLSVRKKGDKDYGTRTEMKNLNSFRAISKAIEVESKRQIDLIESGQKVIQETRRFDEKEESSFTMRSKEDAKDYRYFPDPDLPPIYIDEKLIEKITRESPEFCDEKKERFLETYGISQKETDLLTENIFLADFFEKVAQLSNNPKKASNWLLGENMRILKEKNMEIDEITYSPKNLAKLIKYTDEGKVNSTVAKEIFGKIFEENIDVESFVVDNGLMTVDDEETLKRIIKKVLLDNPKSVEDFHRGKKKAMGFLVGQTMKAMAGKADPAMVNKILKDELEE